MAADGRTVWLRRFGVVPSAQRLGSPARWSPRRCRVADGDEVAVVAREELPATVGFWRGHGFVETDRRSPYLELRRAVPHTYPAPDADAMRDLGRMVGERVRAGDVVVLAGELGAGKTTFTQGLGAGLGVRGDVTSPTFVIARVHPSLGDGPALVHADAYRLGGIDGARRPRPRRLPRRGGDRRRVGDRRRRGSRGQSPRGTDRALQRGRPRR